MGNKMDDAREASRARDAVRKTEPRELAAELQRGPAPYPGAYSARAGRRQKHPPHCPECRDSLAQMWWDNHRGLWVHPRCGMTLTLEEAEDPELYDAARSHAPMTKRMYLTMKTILTTGVTIFGAQEAVASTAIEHPEWDMDEERTWEQWETDTKTSTSTTET